MTNELGRLRHARRAAMLAVLLAGAAAADRSLRAQSPEELDSGTFDLLVNGRVVGTERFVVRHDGTSIRAAARVSLEPGADGLVGGEIRLLLDADFRPNRYELKPEDGPLRSVVGIRQGNRLRLQTDSDDGERVKEFVAPPRLSVLERGIAHHYFLLLQQLGDDFGTATVSLVVPSEGRQFRATVREEGAETVRVGEGTVPSHKYVIEGGGEMHAVWVGEDGRVLRAEIPSRNWVARRRP